MLPEKKSKPSIKIANKLYREKRYSEALYAYRELLNIYPPLSRVIADNIERAEKRIQGTKKAEYAIDSERPVGMQDLYDEVEKCMSSRGSSFLRTDGPLVSVIVTAHNIEEYIEQCLESLYYQSYNNLEVIVVDDNSSDKTQEIVKRLSRSLMPIKVFRLNHNLGTYYAKNYGIKKSVGEVIFFQDGDDVSHPHRISCQMSALLSSSASCVRGAYSRFNVETGKVILVNGLVSKLGLITLGVRREVFKNVGLFNCTTKASDDEFFERFLSVYGREELIDEKMPLYYASMRDESLFSDMVVMNTNGGITQQTSKVRSEYVKKYKGCHEDVGSQDLANMFYYPRIRDAVSVDGALTKLCNPDDPVIVNVCTIPERRKLFRKTIESIASQCDIINVYLDRYDYIPSFLESYGNKVNIYRSQDYPGLRDNGKFLALSEMRGGSVNAYYFTIDDDIEYPPDYVNSMVHKLNYYDNAVVVGVHGVILKDVPRGYFSDKRIVYAFEKPLESDKLVNILGTGTVAFHTKVFNEFSLSTFSLPGMADLYFSAECKSRTIPMCCVGRHENWLNEMELPGSGSLYSEFVENDTDQSEIVINNAPWGYEGIKRVVTKIESEKTRSRIEELLPRMHITTM